MGKIRNLNILAVYDLKDKAGRDSFAGILEMLENKADWHLFVRQPGTDFTARDVLGQNGVDYDGFIVSMPGTADAMAELVKTKKPTVLVNITDRALSSRTENIAFVWCDGAAIGRLGAEHLLSRGKYRSVGYVHELQYQFYSYEREVAFRHAMKQAGLASSAFPPDEDFSDYRNRLRVWLRNLPKPAAVMAVSDMRAADVISICRKEGIAVPEQVAVVGVDNDTAQGDKCGMGISSIRHNMRKLGQTAVRELEFILNRTNRRGRPHEILVPAQDVIARASSACSSSARELVQRAIGFVTANRLRNVTRGEVIAHLGCSRQLAELRFRQVLGRTIRDTIEDVRMEEVNRRLHEEDFSVSETAASLGFPSANYLTRAYRRHFGKSITEARGEG